MQRVAGSGRFQPTDEGVGEEREITDGVEDLVPHEFVGEPELVVEDAGLTNDHRVLEAAAEGEAALAQHLDVTTLRPGESTPLRVTVQTRAASGPIEHEVLVRSNDPETPTLEIRLRATVVAETR